MLPHRFPFLLVDRVTEFVAGERIAGIKRFAVDDAVCQGQPVPMVPGTILIEAVTQLGAILVLARPGMEGKGAVILQIPTARLLAIARPGDELRVEVQVVKLRENFGELRGTVHRDRELVADGQMRFAIANIADLQRGV